MIVGNCSTVADVTRLRRSGKNLSVVPLTGMSQIPKVSFLENRPRTTVGSGNGCCFVLQIPHHAAEDVMG
jgi:hypothetical protein